MSHHILSRQVAQTMLDKWKKPGEWENNIVSQDVHLGKSQVTFPAPDATFEDPTNELTIAMEFKPPTTSKRDILTGIGQVISYLQHSSASYLVIPELVDGFEIGNYICKIFDDKKLNKVLPIGLVVYDNDNASDIKIVKHIDSSITLNKVYVSKNKGRYWAPYKDSNPHMIWLFLEIAYLLKDKNDRRAKIWERFFDDYYCPVEKRYNVLYCDSNITHWDNGNMVAFADRFEPFKEQFRNKAIDEDELKKNIEDIIGKGKSGDNLYTSYSKNFLPLLSHLGLWDEQYYLTDAGYDLHKVGKIHGPNSKTFRDRLSKMILIEGKHLDLILDIENITRNKQFKNIGEAKQSVSKELENKGLIKRNPNRSPNPDNAKDDFISEFQLWNKLGIVKKSGRSYYIEGRGFNFIWDEITRVISN